MPHSKKFEARRSELYNQMKAIIARDGYENITIRTLCQEINISTGTFYHYFPNKGDLATVLFQSMDDYLASYTAEVFGDDPYENLLTFIKAYSFHTLKNGVEACRLISAEPLHNNDKNHLEEDRAVFQILLNCIKSGQQTGNFTNEIDAISLTRMILTTMRGYSADWAKHNGLYHLETALLDHLNFFSKAFRIEQTTK